MQFSMSIIHDGHTGFLCQSGGATAFVAKIWLLYSELDLRTTIGNNARTYAESHFDVAQSNERGGTKI